MCVLVHLIYKGVCFIILIAVGSLNGETVDFHLGKSKKLYVYNVQDENYEFVETRIVDISDNDKHQGGKVLDVCNDCDVIITQQYGPKSKIKANKLNIKLVTNEGKVDDVLKQYIEHYKFMNE